MDHDHAGHRERLRARFQQDRKEGFCDHELLELLLTYAIPRRDTNALAHKLMNRFGSLSGVLEADMSELTQVEGIGESAATLILMLLPLFKRYQQERFTQRTPLNNMALLGAYCRTLFYGVHAEQFYVLSLDARLCLIHADLIASGTPNQVRVSPREVASVLLRRNAVGAVLVHNHPAGSELPSAADVETTAQIAATLSALGIALYDHVLVAGHEAVSFKQHRLMTGFTGMNDGAVACEQPRRG